MDSMLILSPPISAPIAARSCVAVTTLIFPAAKPDGTLLNKRATPAKQLIKRSIFINSSLEWMRSMRSDRKLKLKQELVRRQAFAITGAAQLSANLAELAGPIGEHQRSTGVLQQRGIRG